MMKKILTGFVAAAIMGGIFAAGVEFGQYLKERENGDAVESTAPATND